MEHNNILVEHKELIHEKEGAVKAYEQRREALLALNKLIDVPEDFCCPLSGRIMKDPVIASSGVTFERNNIQLWRKGGHERCPRSHVLLTNEILQPDNMLKVTISEWCKEHYGDNYLDFPEEFYCPISGLIMVDPVLISTGMTYEREYIEAWLEAGGRWCPRSKETLSTTRIWPNIALQSVIFTYCQKRNIKLPAKGEMSVYKLREA